MKAAKSSCLHLVAQLSGPLKLWRLLCLWRAGLSFTRAAGASRPLLGFPAQQIFAQSLRRPLLGFGVGSRPRRWSQFAQGTHLFLWISTLPGQTRRIEPDNSSFSACRQGVAHPGGLWHVPRLLGQGSSPLSPSRRCRSSVVEHPLGKGEVRSSILRGSTIFLLFIKTFRRARATWRKDLR